MNPETSAGCEATRGPETSIRRLFQDCSASPLKHPPDAKQRAVLKRQTVQVGNPARNKRRSRLL